MKFRLQRAPQRCTLVCTGHTRAAATHLFASICLLALQSSAHGECLPRPGLAVYKDASVVAGNAVVNDRDAGHCAAWRVDQISTICNYAQGTCVWKCAPWRHACGAASNQLSLQQLAQDVLMHVAALLGAALTIKHIGLG